MHRLRSGKLRMPSGKQAEQWMGKDKGYVPLNHRLRDGASTISWYRGPLVPDRVGDQRELPLLGQSADELTRYDPETGMYDVSYTAAWELGRLLTLRDEPVALQDWCHDLSLLRGVPFNYLVPRERMLPREALRFFWIDPFWVRCILDGALSVARVPDFESLGNELRPEASLPATVTGFLMRSELVSDWPDLQVDGYEERKGEGKHKLPTPRPPERLSSDVLICLFAGAVTTVDVQDGVGEGRISVRSPKAG